MKFNDNMNVGTDLNIDATVAVGLDTDASIFIDTSEGRLFFTQDETLALAKFFSLVDPRELAITLDEQMDADCDEGDE